MSELTSLTPPLEGPHLIGITGFKESGKDSVAALLSMLGYGRLAFADGVREEVLEAATTGFVPPEIKVDQVLYAALVYASKYPEAVYAKPTVPMIRKLLQWWGTEYRRDNDPRYWIDRLATDTGFMFGLPVAITDVRFQNEATFVRENDGIIWRVERPNTGGDDTHISELEVSQIEPDQVIKNDGTLRDLAEAVLSALETATYGE
jgi:hypothetical protein